MENYKTLLLSDGKRVQGIAIVDSDGNIITAFGGGSSANAAAIIASATHRSPFDFTATYTSAATITLSGNETITQDSQINYIKIIPSSGNAIVYVNGGEDITMRHSGGVITISGATPFASGDVYEVGLTFQDKAYDGDNDLIKNNEQSPIWGRYTDSGTIVTNEDIGDTDDTWKDQSLEIDLRGYETATIWVSYTDNDSIGGQMQILSYPESGGTGHKGEISADYQKTLIADDSIYYKWEIDNCLPFIKIQTKATTVGATEGTVTIKITKGY